MNFITDRLQQILGMLSGVVGAVVSFAAAGGLNQIVGARELQILGLLSVVLGAATAASGNNQSSKAKVAEAMQTAINSTPGPKQGGFARIGMLIAIAMVSMLMLSACATTGGRAIDPTAKAAIETTVRIAVRRSVAESPRSLAKAQNIRNVVLWVQSTTSAESTVAAIKAAVLAEVDKLELPPLDRADAIDLIDLLQVALEARFQGPDAAVLDTVVKVNEFLQFVLSALPAPAT